MGENNCVAHVQNAHKPPHDERLPHTVFSVCSVCCQYDDAAVDGVAVGDARCDVRMWCDLSFIQSSFRCKWIVCREIGANRCSCFFLSAFLCRRSFVRRRGMRDTIRAAPSAPNRVLLICNIETQNHALPFCNVFDLLSALELWRAGSHLRGHATRQRSTDMRAYAGICVWVTDHLVDMIAMICKAIIYTTHRRAQQHRAISLCDDVVVCVLLLSVCVFIAFARNCT